MDQHTDKLGKLGTSIALVASRYGTICADRELLASSVMIQDVSHEIIRC